MCSDVLHVVLVFRYVTWSCAKMSSNVLVMHCYICTRMCYMC